MAIISETPSLEAPRLAPVRVMSEEMTVKALGSHALKNHHVLFPGTGSVDVGVAPQAAGARPHLGCLTLMELSIGCRRCEIREHLYVRESARRHSLGQRDCRTLKDGKGLGARQ